MTDLELARAAGRGDRAAFEALVRSHYDSARALGARLAGGDEAGEEAVQRAFVRAHAALAEFRGESSFRTWLFRIVMNEACGAGREAERRERMARSAAAAGVPGRRSAFPDPADAAEAADLAERVREELVRLPSKARAALTLVMDHGMDYREIAELLGCSYDAVKVHICQARRKLKDRLREYLGPSPE